MPGGWGTARRRYSSDGKVRIEAKGRHGVEPHLAVVYETEALKQETLESIFKAADAALQEKPFTRRGANEDGKFLRLELSGPQPNKVGHNQMNDYCDTPPAMRKFVVLVNELLPEGDRIPLKRCTEAEKDKASGSR